jgi:hypothetical protein
MSQESPLSTDRPTSGVPMPTSSSEPPGVLPLFPTTPQDSAEQALYRRGYRTRCA